MQTALFRKNALLIEHDPVQSTLYEDILNANGFDIHKSCSAIEGFQTISNKQYDIVVINTEISEEQILNKLISKAQKNEELEKTPIIGLSIYGNEKKISEKLDAYLTKPISIDRFIECILNSIEKKINGCQNSYNQRLKE